MTDLDRGYFLQYGERPESWQRFLANAARGSQKALEMLRLAEQAFLKDSAGKLEPKNLKLDQYYLLLTDSLPIAPPLPTVEEFVSIAGCNPIALSDQPIHDRRFYDCLWHRAQEVSVSDLVFDAVSHCLRTWNPAEYRMLSEAVGYKFPDYNSRDIVAAMVYLFCGWKAAVIR